jgi:hypothetical protein
VVGRGQATAGRRAVAGRRTKRRPHGWIGRDGAAREEEEAPLEEKASEEEAAHGGGAETSGHRSAERRMRRRRGQGAARRGGGVRRRARREALLGRVAAARSARDDCREGGCRGTEGQRGGAMGS